MSKGLRPRIRQITQNLAAEMVRNPAPDLVSDFAAPLPLLVISELLGVPSDMRAWFREQAANLQEASTSRAERAPGGQARSESAARALIAYFSAETERPGRKDREDLIGLLLRAEEKDQGLTRPVVIANCIHLLSAGHETTTGLIGKAFLALMRAPEQADLLRAEPELLPGAVEEFLRYDPPVQMVSRWAIKDTPVGERVIPRGAKTVVVLGSANRDERHFTSPDMLNLRRDARGHQAFGFGPHFCLGSRLAVAEAEIAIGELLHLAPRLHTSLPIRYEDDLVFHGPRSIPVFFAE
uniref:LooP n=1 Tax=Nocardiopsis flavescens TaxID=758803 RepID=A0A6M5K9Z9_9ACTN|nr:LooP [Nocardiopsis flavescens]